MHLADISWAQWFLIEVGALLLVGAVCACVKDAALRSEVTTPNKEAADLSANSMRAQGDNSTASNGVQLMQTAKVKFVQSFKFREQESNQHFSRD